METHSIWLTTARELWWGLLLQGINPGIILTAGLKGLQGFTQKKPLIQLKWLNSETFPPVTQVTKKQTDTDQMKVIF